MKGYDFKQLSVLFVDDEEQACKYFRLALEPEFVVLTARSAAEALETLRHHGSGIGIVISDQRMPGDSGSTFLTKVRHEEPKTVRILTTAYSDMDAAIEAVNSGAIYKYIVKPWDLNDLRITLRRAMEYRLLRQERDLLVDEKLATLQHLIVADRVRSLAVLAKGLSHHIRNALTALESYVFLAKAELEREPGRFGSEYDYWREIWTDAESVNRRLLELVESVSDATFDPKYRFDDTVELGALIDSGHARACQTGDLPALRVLASTAPVALQCDATLMTRMFAALLRQLARVSGGNSVLTLEYLGATTVWGSPAQWVRLRSTDEWDSQAVSSLFTPFAVSVDGSTKADSDLLTAFFIAHHHGGTLDMHTRGPEGPGFELKLPINPLQVERPGIEKGLLERMFLHAEEWERIKRGG
jgi:two-component system, probable response regulator PhcQ